MLEFSLADEQPVLLKLWRSFLGLAALQCLLALGIVWKLRHLTGGLRSPVQLLFAGVVLLLLSGFLILFAQSWTNRTAAHRQIQSALRFVQHPRRFATLAVLTSVLFFLGTFSATLLPETSEPFTRAILGRALPAALLVAGLSLQTLAALLIVRHGFNCKLAGKRIFWSILILALGLFLYWNWLSVTVIPSAARIEGWNTMGVPILEQQVLAAWLLGMGVMLLIHLTNVRRSVSSRAAPIKRGRIDLGISLVIWLGAVLIWQSIPVQPNWFLTGAVYPNNEPYPASDARIYDRTAQSALVGSGYRFSEDINIRRPLHAMYLTLLHLAAGQDYARLVFFQIVVLALFPVTLFWIAKNLHNRVSGVIAATLVIFREANAISLSAVLTTANAKLLLVDLPTAALLALFFYLAILWLKRDPHNLLWALVSGQALGLAILIRPETIILGAAPALVLFMVVRRERNYLKLLRQLALFTFGVLLVLSPWVWRNWRLTGMIYLNDPHFRFGIIRQRFAPESRLTLPNAIEEGALPNPAHSGGQLAYTGIMPGLAADSAPQRSKLADPPAVALQATPTPGPHPKTPEEIEQAARERLLHELGNPLRLLQVNSAHYLNSQFQSLLIFPSTFRGVDSMISFLGHRNLSRLWSEWFSADSYIRRLSYWHKWQGEFDFQSLLPLILTVVLIAAGIQTAWNRGGWTGLLLLLGATIYFLGNAVFRNSGGRYILAVDWIYIVYYSIGLAHLSCAAIGYLRRVELYTHFPDEEAETRGVSHKAAGFWIPAALAASFLLVSIAIPLVERSFPQRYTVLRKAQMLETLLTSADVSTADRQMLQAFLDQGAVTVGGRVLYPQYYPPNVGSLGKTDAPIKPMPYSRLVFTINGERNLGLTLPVDSRSAPIPNASDGLAFLCPVDENYALALGIIDAQNRVQSITLISPQMAQVICPLELGAETAP